jgi:hypothetical protein
MSAIKTRNNAETIIKKMIALFEKYRDEFGVNEEYSLECQCHFEDQFIDLVCEYKGHRITSSHDYCSRCGRVSSKIGH